jgi:hypothetical protein
MFVMVKCGGIKELVGNRYKSRRVKETSEGGQILYEL